MKRTLVYGDLGPYLDDRRGADKTDQTVRNMGNAWNKFMTLVPDAADTSVSDEATDKLVHRFTEAARGDLQDSTIANYTNAFRRALGMLQDHLDTTGSTRLPQPPSTPLYSDLGVYFESYRDRNPQDATAKRWVGTYQAVVGRVPEAAEMTIDPEHTEQILLWFAEIATDPAAARNAADAVASYDEEAGAAILEMAIVKPATMHSYQSWFRQGLRHYCKATGLAYAEIDAEERRRRASSLRDAAQEPEVDPGAYEEETAETEEDPNEYCFRLRSDLVIALSLPEDLTRREAERFGQWISSFVLEPE